MNYKITKVSDFTKDWEFTDKKTGNEVQLTTFYAEVEGVDGVVDINKKRGSDGPVAGDTLDGTVTASDFVDKAGKEHYRFKATPKGFGGNAELTNLVKDCLERLDRIEANVLKLVGPPEEEKEEDEDEEINLDSIPF
jgi:hypothetical protein